MQQRFSIPIMASRESAPLIAQSPKLLPYQELVWGYPVPTEVSVLADKVETKNHLFHVIETPGHCPGHVAFVEMARGWCFTGDLFISREPKAMRPEEDIYEIARSMKKLVDLQTGEAHPVHRPGERGGGWEGSTASLHRLHSRPVTKGQGP